MRKFHTFPKEKGRGCIFLRRKICIDAYFSKLERGLWNKKRP
jgi:hypothetical protein